VGTNILEEHTTTYAEKAVVCFPEVVWLVQWPGYGLDIGLQNSSIFSAIKAAPL